MTKTHPCATTFIKSRNPLPSLPPPFFHPSIHPDLKTKFTDGQRANGDCFPKLRRQKRLARFLFGSLFIFNLPFFSGGPFIQTYPNRLTRWLHLLLLAALLAQLLPPPALMMAAPSIRKDLNQPDAETETLAKRPQLFTEPVKEPVTTWFTSISPAAIYANPARRPAYQTEEPPATPTTEATTTETPVPTDTPTPPPADTATALPTDTDTPPATATTVSPATDTPTPTDTTQPLPETETPTPEPTATVEVTETPTLTPTVVLTLTPTLTPTATLTLTLSNPGQIPVENLVISSTLPAELSYDAALGAVTPGFNPLARLLTWSIPLELAAQPALTVGFVGRVAGDAPASALSLAAEISPAPTTGTPP